MRVYLLTAVTFAAATAAFAQPTPKAARMAWATFLRAGPGHNYGSLDEIDRDERVGVLGCDRGWCAVSWDHAFGYIEQDALELASPPNGKAPAGGPQGCFAASSIGWLRPVFETFCETKK
jgi:uncharacterized protein YraI